MSATKTTLTATECTRAGAAITKTTVNAQTYTVYFQVAYTGLEMIFVENVDASNARTITFPHASGYMDSDGHHADLVVTIPVSSTIIIGPFNNTPRWKNSDGYLYVTASAEDADLKVWAVRNPTTSTEADTKS